MSRTDYISSDLKHSLGMSLPCHIREIIIKDGAIKELTGIIEKNNYKSIFIAADENTWKAAGKQTLKAIEQAARDTDMRKEIQVTKYIFKSAVLAPDETAVAALLIHSPSDSDLIVGIGAGTINDLCKLISRKLKTDYAVIATAPSNKGYSTDISYIVTDNKKRAIQTKQPDYIIGDLKVLCKAPSYLTAAGIGELLGNYISLADLQLGRLMEETDYDEHIGCDEQEDIIRNSAETALRLEKAQEADGDGFLADSKTIKIIMEELIKSGVALNSIKRQTDFFDSIHYLTCILEKQLLTGELNIQHEKISYGNIEGIMVLRLIKMLEKLENRDMTEVILDSLPLSEDVAEVLKAVGAPYKVKHIGLSNKLLKKIIEKCFKEEGNEKKEGSIIKLIMY